MGLYKTKYNPFSKSLQWVLKGTLIAFKEGVDTYNDLPVTGNSQNEARIANDTGHLYVWSIEESSGNLSDWIDQGDVLDLQWDTIEGKPSSTPVNIDDAVSKKHIQNTDTKLDEDGDNEITASELVKNIYNVVLLAFKVAVQGSLALFNLVDGIVDEYEDESGIDTSSSTNITYNSFEKYYTPYSIDYGIDEYVKLMLHCNGTDGSTSFPDSSDSAHTVTANGDAQVDTSVKKFGTGSAQFDGTGDYLTVPDSSQWDFGTDDFTIDFWVRFNNIPSSPEQTIISHYPGIATSGSWSLVFGTGGISFWMHDGGWTQTYHAITISTGQWYHYAIVREGTNLRFFQDGSLIATQSSSQNLTLATDTVLGIGGQSNGTRYFNGYIDELRVSKGIARWTSNFTPPTSEYSTTVDIFNMSLISENFEAESEPDSARIVIFEEDVDAITLNTDLKAYISRDDGSTWAEATLSDEGDYDATKRILVGNVDLSASGIGSGTDMVYKLDTDNTKNLKIHGTALLWD